MDKSLDSHLGSAHLYLSFSTLNEIIMGVSLLVGLAFDRLLSRKLRLVS